MYGIPRKFVYENFIHGIWRLTFDDIEIRVLRRFRVMVSSRRCIYLVKKSNTKQMLVYCIYSYNDANGHMI